MSPPEHFLFGALAGTVIYAAQKKPGLVRWLGCCVLTGTGSLAPDMDSGVSAYASANAWIGHRGWTHSLLFAALYGIVTAAGARMRNFKLMTPALVFACGFIGVCLHILGDMPTPPGSWGGLPVFFPHPARFGGTGNIGWYNPVLFWKVSAFFAASALCVAGGLIAKGSFERLRGALRILGGAIALGGFTLAALEIQASRYADSVSWHAAQERQLKEMPWPVHPLTAELAQVGMKIFARVRAH